VAITNGAAEADIGPGVQWHHRDDPPLRRGGELEQLLAHGSFVAHGLPQRALADQGDEGRRRLAFEDLLPSHSGADSGPGVIAERLQRRPGVRFDLEQARMTDSS
jgi:hypothetical protein